MLKDWSYDMSADPIDDEEENEDDEYIDVSTMYMHQVLDMLD